MTSFFTGVAAFFVTFGSAAVLFDHSKKDSAIRKHAHEFLISLGNVISDVFEHIWTIAWQSIRIFCLFMAAGLAIVITLKLSKPLLEIFPW